MTGEPLWFLSRATGVVSLVLLTCVLVLGMLTAGRRRPRGDFQTIIVALHRSLSLGMVVFLLGHIVTAVIDSYVSISWYAAVLPFTSGYKPFWVGLGTISFDILAAVVVTSLLRRRLGERTWRTVHLAAYALWPLAIVHGLVMGTSQGWLLQWVTMGCGLVGVLVVLWRLDAVHADSERRSAILEHGQWR